MSQNLPKRSLGDVLSLRHPNHFVLAGTNNRNIIITYRFLAAPVQANRDFFLYWLYDCIFQLQVLSLIYARVTRVPPRDFAFWAKSLRGQLYGNMSFRPVFKGRFVCIMEGKTSLAAKPSSLKFPTLLSMHESWNFSNISWLRQFGACPPFINK